ncbi:MAG TPA: hypothetical protein VGJ60_24565 [Chloroflexota bacterium]|jgi:DNA-binding response OmpR family regulator
MRDSLSRHRGRVLLLEDDPALLALLVEFLASEGFEVAACHSYASLREALDAADRPPIVVADCWGGSQATLTPCERDQIRELGRSAPTVLFTGRAWASSATAAELDVVCLLVKPLVLEDLLAQILRCLERERGGQ